MKKYGPYVKSSNAKAYDGGYAMGTVKATYGQMLELFGEPSFKNGDSDFPDDTSKVDVVWMLLDDYDVEIDVWNYKDGPAYSDEPLEGINHFSCYSENPTALKMFLDYVESNKKEITRITV